MKDSQQYFVICAFKHTNYTFGVKYLVDVPNEFANDPVFEYLGPYDVVESYFKQRYEARFGKEFDGVVVLVEEVDCVVL